MHDRPPFLPFDDERAWLPELPRSQAGAPPPWRRHGIPRRERAQFLSKCQSTQTKPRHVALRIWRLPMSILP